MTWRDEANLAWLAGLAGVERDHPLARHTSLAIGGPAEFFVETGSSARLEQLVEGCHRRAIPCLVLGAGTNLLVADAGIEGLVVRCVSREWRVEGERVRAAAGLKMMRLARICADHQLAGFEWAIGVPGTVGGAVYQDAGCWGTELREVLVEVEGWIPGRGRVRWAPEALRLGYRTSALRDGSLHGSLVTAATIGLRPGDGAASRARMARWTADRMRTQPIRARSCGSVFRNPEGDSAGRLVEAAGLKGAALGGAAISEQHANFIVNRGGATAAEVARLIGRAQAEVRRRFGVELEPEVELVGRWIPGEASG